MTSGCIDSNSVSAGKQNNAGRWPGALRPRFSHVTPKSQAQAEPHDQRSLADSCYVQMKALVLRLGL
jgi:hypothetical protein